MTEVVKRTDSSCVRGFQLTILSVISHTSRYTQIVERLLEKFGQEQVDRFVVWKIQQKKSKIHSSLSSRYYAQPCNEWRSLSPQLSVWATQLRRNVAEVASRWRHCADLSGPGIEPQTFRTDSPRLTTELTAI